MPREIHSFHSFDNPRKQWVKGSGCHLLSYDNNVAFFVASREEKLAQLRAKREKGAADEEALRQKNQAAVLARKEQVVSQHTVKLWLAKLFLARLRMLFACGVVLRALIAISTTSECLKPDTFFFYLSVWMSS